MMVLVRAVTPLEPGSRALVGFGLPLRAGPDSGFRRNDERRNFRLFGVINAGNIQGAFLGGS
jgi:hypothetical protein